MQLALDPSLGVSARQFAAGWNADARARGLARAEVQPAGAGVYDALAADLLALVLVPLAVGLATNGLYDLIKDILLAQCTCCNKKEGEPPCAFAQGQRCTVPTSLDTRKPSR